MTDTTTPAETWALTVEAGERMWDAIATVRDASPREKGDASTDDLMDALAPLIGAHARKAQAAELRRLAKGVWDCASPEDASVWLRARADELDPR